MTDTVRPIGLELSDVARLVAEKVEAERERCARIAEDEEEGTGVPLTIAAKIRGGT